MEKDICPMCGSKKYKYVSYSEFGWGIVEQHGYCDRCGYTIEQAYSQSIDGIEYPIRKGFRDYYGKYHAKNVHRRNRIARKYNLKHQPTDWILSKI